MRTKYLQLIFLVFAILPSFVARSNNTVDIEEGHIKVAMRMIGHQVLLNSCDSTSRVLAIEKNTNRYKIQFESDFQFDPDVIISTINQVIKETGIAKSYLVEFVKCSTGLVIYSYEIGLSTKSDLTPCRSRPQPEDCYELYITLLDSEKVMTTLLSLEDQAHSRFDSGKKEASYFKSNLFILPLFVLFGFVMFYWKSKAKSVVDPNLIRIGEYQFDKNNMALSFENIKTELTSKESDLLFLLYNSANTILDRDNILKMVWGDEGDYVGRTLDVFISKLRKKLSMDSSLKIINIRGIGYKFVMNNH